MSSFDLSTMDFVRELRLRQWSRQHFVPPETRKSTWHPVVLDEMKRRDQELLNEGDRKTSSPPYSTHLAETV